MAATTEQYTKAEKHLNKCTMQELTAIAEAWFVDIKPCHTRKVTKQCSKSQLVDKLISHEWGRRNGDLNTDYYREYLEAKSLNELKLICKYQAKIPTTYQDYTEVKKLARKSHLINEILWYTEFAYGF